MPQVITAPVESLAAIDPNFVEIVDDVDDAGDGGFFSANSLDFSVGKLVIFFLVYRSMHTCDEMMMRL